jgi:hypothetical protein
MSESGESDQNSRNVSLLSHTPDHAERSIFRKSSFIKQTETMNNAQNIKPYNFGNV